MIAHHCIGTDIDGENLGEKKNSLFDPRPAVFEALPGIGVLATQKGSADTARDAMIKRRAFQADLVLASNSHGVSTSLPTSGLNRTNRAVYSESLWVSLLL
jgi:hypothetical protein